MCALQLLKRSQAFLKTVHPGFSSLELQEKGGFVCPTLRFCGLSLPSSSVLWLLSRGREEGAASVVCGWKWWCQSWSDDGGKGRVRRGEVG